MKIAQILVAAGKGARFGGEIPKQYQDLYGRPVLEHTLNAMTGPGQFSKTVVVVAKDDPYIHKLISGREAPPTIVTGGASRTASVKAGLAALADNPPDLVLIHDGARPFVTQHIIDKVVSALSKSEAVVPVTPIVDAVKAFESNVLGDDVDRKSLRQVQTPQGFKFGPIWAAYQALDENADLPDDIAVARQAGLSISTVAGDPENFKITHSPMI